MTSKLPDEELLGWKAYLEVAHKLEIPVEIKVSDSDVLVMLEEIIELRKQAKNLQHQVKVLDNSLFWLLNLHHGVSADGSNVVSNSEWESALNTAQAVHEAVNRE